MKFKLNKLTLLLLSAPVAVNAGISLSGTGNSPKGGLPPVTNDTTQEHKVTNGVTIAEGAVVTPTYKARGEMTINNGSKLWITGTLMIGNQNDTGYGGKVTVSGEGSQLRLHSSVENGTAALKIGNYSDGSLSVLNGAKIESTYKGRNDDDANFWAWLRHSAPNRQKITANILVDGEKSELLYPNVTHDAPTIRASGGDGNGTNATSNFVLKNGGKLRAYWLSLEDGTTNIKIGENSKGGVFDVTKISISPRTSDFKNITFTFDQTDDFEFKPEVTADKAGYKAVNFVQNGSGTTLFAPTSMTNVNSKVDITNGTLKVGVDNAFGNNAVTSNVTVGENGKLVLNNHDASVTSINNQGTIDLTSSDADKTLTVRGDYAANNGKLIVKTNWNTNSTSSDALDIQGSATGTTVVSTLTGFIEGDVLRQAYEDIYSAAVVKVADANHTGRFTGTAKTTNAGEAQLTQKDANTYAWTLKAYGHDIYAAPASAYIQMPRVNMELGYSVLDTLHQRRGEVAQSPNSAVWARVSGKRLETEGRSRLDVDSSQYIAQVGYDFNRSEAQDGRPQSLSGVYFAYSRADSRFYDQYRAENGVLAANKYTGKGKTIAANLGAYHLYRAANNAYIDTVAQFSYLTNKYHSDLDREIRQHGWSGAVSVEGGHSFALGNSNWRLEPQTQLVYQHLKLQSFHDGDHGVAQGSDNNLRGRLGVRLSHSKDFQRNPTAYFVANVWHDFVGAKSVLIGDTKYGENYARTWMEAGAGLNVPFGNQAIHADIRFEHSLGSKGHRSGAKAVLGYSYAW